MKPKPQNNGDVKLCTDRLSARKVNLICADFQFNTLMWKLCSFEQSFFLIMPISYERISPAIYLCIITGFPCNARDSIRSFCTQFSCPLCWECKSTPCSKTRTYTAQARIKRACFLCYFILGFTISAARSANTITAQIPPAVAVSPPVKIPMKPSLATASCTPLPRE